MEHKAKIMLCPQCKGEAIILEKYGICIPCLHKNKLSEENSLVNQPSNRLMEDLRQ